MKKPGLLQKFWILSGVFGIVLAIVIAAILNISQDNTHLVERDNPVLNKSHELKLAVVQVQQWLTDISATRGLDGLNDGFNEAGKQAARFNQLISELGELAPENKTQYKAMVLAFNQYYEVGQRMAKAYVADGPAGGNKTMENFDKAAAEITEQVDTLLSGAKANMLKLLEHEKAQLATTKLIVLVAVLVLGAIMLAIFLMLSRSLRVLPRISAEMEHISHGELSEAAIMCSRSDEIGVLVAHINEMKNGLREVIKRVSHSATEVFNTTQKLSQITRVTEQGMRQQQSEVQQVVTAMTEMSATASEVARNAVAVSESSRTANTEAEEGSQVVAVSVNMINNLAQDVEKAAEVIHQLEEESESIGTILDVIRGIAEQTNLLALNAAIEAARAGEQGRGFAVVADEVRTLAGRTQQSTQQIQEVIERLQSTARDAVAVMGRGRSQASESVDQARQAGEKLGVITQTVSSITGMNHQIASAAEEQSAVVEEITRNITAINEISGQTFESTQSLSHASTELDQEATNLRDMVKQFKL